MRFSAGILVALAATTTTTTAFVPLGLVTSRTVALSSTTAGRLETIENESKTQLTKLEELTSWECNDDAECVEVPACDEMECRTSLDVRIHGEWYDLTGESSNSFTL